MWLLVFGYFYRRAMLQRYIHALFLCMVEHSIMYMDLNLFIHSFICGHLGCAIEWMLVSLPPFICWNTNTQCAGISIWGLLMMLNSWGWNKPPWTGITPYKRGSREIPCPSLAHEGTERRCWLWTRKRALTKLQQRQCLHFELGSLQSYEKWISVI